MTFANLPIRRKLLALVLTITAIVLLASCAILVVFDLVTLRRELIRELGTLSDVIAANSTATLAFDARDEANELLRTLAAERSVVLAALYDSEGRIFASHSPGMIPPPDLGLERGNYQRFENDHFLTVRQVFENEKMLGTLVIYSDLQSWYMRLWIYLGIVVGVVGLAFAAATVFSTFLRKAITRPVDELARIASQVSAQGNFAVRARRFGNDELGALTDTFNHMLAQIQQREAELRESEEQRKIALEAAGLGTWRYDPATGMTTRDSSLNRLLGLRDEPSTSALEEFLTRVHPEDRPATEATLNRCLRTEQAIDLEYRVVTPDGDTRWLRDRGRPIKGNDGRSLYFAGAVLDITDRKTSEEEILRLNADLEKRVAKRTAELEDSNRNLEAFAYSVSHDLRAPLRIISGYAEVLLEDRGAELPADQKLCLGRIVDGARKMNRLIDDLLQFSRLGQQPLKLQNTMLDRIVDDALQELTSDAAKRNIDWRRPGLPTVECDPGLMRQVFTNLLSNALKYSRPRDPAVIEVGFKEADDQYVVYVRDNGVGFDSQASHRLFGVFQRLHSAQEFEGNGVGLAIAARIIRRHGGRIWAESQPNQGATFFFTLPHPTVQERVDVHVARPRTAQAV
jgi:PAS domain S-box-containing protein